MGILGFIENADATPPHLDVFLHLGCSGDLLGTLQFLCIGVALSDLFCPALPLVFVLLTPGSPGNPEKMREIGARLLVGFW